MNASSGGEERGHSEGSPQLVRRLNRNSGASRRRGRLWLAGVGLALLALVLGGLVVFFVGRSGDTPPMPPESDLDLRWGTYVSERGWGTPREAVGEDGWGLSWRGAIDTDYRYAADGIAGISDTNGEFGLSWAFWDGGAPHVTERFYGVNNPQGESGEEIVDDRVFRENTPRHAYSRLSYRYPAKQYTFDIQLESAKFDSARLVMSATVANTGAERRQIQVVLKSWQADPAAIEPIEGGLLLRGTETAVAVVGVPATAWQTSADRGALDVNLRGSGLAGNGTGNIGALAYRLELDPQSSAAVRVAIAEVPLAEAATAAGRARAMLGQAAQIVSARRSDARRLFRGEVTAYEDVYRQALTNLLWGKTYYRWDGTSGVNSAWAGRVDARDILIVPDKWEFPWPASWDSAFQAVTATLVDPALAEEQLRFQFSERWQQPDGHVPCGEWVMDEECPPIFAWAAWTIYEHTRDRTFLADIYPGLQRQYDYWWQNHQVGEALFGGGFLGMDNLPRSPGGAQADGSAWMAFFARDMARIASELRDTEASERYWIDRGKIQDAINSQLWDEASGFYYDRTSDGQLVLHKSYSGLVPLIAGVVPAARIPALLSALRDENQFLSPAGVRSLSAASELYVAGEAGSTVNSNWRGPVWVPINYLLLQRLADVDPRFAAELRERLVEAVERDWRQTGRLHEFFDGDSGAGLGADAQGWTSLVANLIAEGWPSDR